MFRSGAAMLGVLALDVALTACGGDDGAQSEETETQSASGKTPTDDEAGADASDDASGPPDVSEELPLVANYSGEGGAPSAEPEAIGLSEFSAVRGLEWERWDGERAVGNGLLSGIWCSPDCTDTPFETAITLSDPEEVDGQLYFTTFVLDSQEAENYRPGGLEVEFEVEDLSGERPLATG
ncbi:hypothetical protein [Streptomyces zhaozhouensis]|uniref:hypothetical protein n=1 Tax=Streptomyces zhaozhouensis TaxID=1300267 RepID=UPI00114437D4|nr:hypothetical protein [Streptomyces zhaozhouensis]